MSAWWHGLSQALADAIADTKRHIRNERNALRRCAALGLTGHDRDFAERELQHYLAIQRRQVARARNIS